MIPTEKLYYTDPYLKNTTATILKKRKEKESWWYAFDRTIFYPGGGGQSPDEGFINSNELIDIKEEGGVIWHELSRELTGNVSMELKWSLRIRRMQQHTGQHLISAVFYREFGINTVSVHLGQTDTLIEFDTSDISAAILREAEDRINAKIREHIAIRSHWVPKKKLSAYDLRRDIKVESDPVRLIHIDNYDVTGCGGTHVGSTSEIGLVKIIGTEKIRKRTRIQFRIGESAYQLFTQLVTVIQKLSNNLSSSYEDLEMKISKLLDEQKDLRRILNVTRKNWLQLRIEQLNCQDRAGFFVMKDLSQTDLVDISLYWLEKFQKPCFFICEEDNKYFFTIRSILEKRSSALNFIKTVGARFGLKGGGSNEFVQGIISQTVVQEDYLAALKEAFEENISRE